jgi:plasmid maintenance system antidote protein VapI
MARKQAPKTVSEHLRARILDGGVSRYRIAKDTGIEQSALSRFISGERGLSQDAIDTLADYLGLRIVVDKRFPKPKGK